MWCDQLNLFNLARIVPAVVSCYSTLNPRLNVNRNVRVLKYYNHMYLQLKPQNILNVMVCTIFHSMNFIPCGELIQGGSLTRKVLSTDIVIFSLFY